MGDCSSTASFVVGCRRLERWQPFYIEGRGCECQRAGTFAGTVTGSTGAEVIALGTVIGIVGATAAKATKPG
jgi:hypothetical protein